MTTQQKLTAAFSELDRVTPRPLTHEDYAIEAIRFYAGQTDELSKAQERVKRLELALSDIATRSRVGIIKQIAKKALSHE